MLFFNMKFKQVVFVLMVFIATDSLANEPHNQSLENRANDYIRQQVLCQTIIEDLNWKYRIWPNDKIVIKPARSEIIDHEAILKGVEENVSMENTLQEVFGIEITHEMIQAELDRIVQNTKDPARLIELFEALDNDPGKIAACVVRPNLVKKSIHDAFSWDQNIHNKTLLLANSELQSYQATGSMEGSTARVFISESDPQADDKTNEYTNGYSALGTNIFAATSDALESLAGDSSTPGLQEKETGFLYQEVIEKTADEVVRIKNIVWKKQIFSQWWKAQNKNPLPTTLKSNTSPYSILSVSHSMLAASTSPSAAPANSWSGDHLAVGISEATAIWTGTEMIIWGGRNMGHLNYGGRYNPVTDSWRSMSIDHSLEPRRDHTAVWTGTDMIVWGGWSEPDYLNSGGIYDPDTDTWTMMSVTNSPSVRSKHTAVWTGSKMIIWGGRYLPAGYYSPLDLGDGAIYDLETDTWSAVGGEINKPSIRSGHTAVWTGSKMIIWGAPNKSGGIYDIATDSWVKTSTGDNTPDGYLGHTAVWTGSKMIIWGGQGQYGVYPTAGGVFNPDSNTWSPTSIAGPDTPLTRSNHSAVWNGTEMLIWGGYRSGYLADGARYNPVDDSWTSISSTNAPVARHFHLSVWTGEEMIIWGGSGIGDINTAAKYKPSDNTWTSSAVIPSPAARGSHTSVWTGNELIIWGGKSNLELSTGGVYMPVTDSWKKTPTVDTPLGRVNHSAVWTGTEMIVFGGFSTGYNSENSGAKYNPSLDTWTAISTTNAPAARAYHSAVWTGSEMIVWGGSVASDYSNANYLNDGGQYDPLNDLWVATGTLDAPAKRVYQSAVWTGSKMVIWGGYDGLRPMNTGGQYEPETMTWSSTSIGAETPTAYLHSMIWTGSKIIVWGGNSYGGSNLGAVYNPVDDIWSATSLVNAPGARFGHTAIWTGQDMVVWGGRYGGSVYLNDGGIYNLENDQWTATSEVDAAWPRQGHTAEWTGQTMLVFGGSGLDSAVNKLGVFYPYKVAPPLIFKDGFE